VLALRGGGELVALWAQLSTLIELVASVALAGVGTGLAVYVARTQRPERQADLLREALRIGLGVAAPVALVVAIAGGIFADALFGEKLRPALIAIGAAAGWLAVIPGVVNNLWLGQRRRGLVLTLTVSLLVPGSALLPALAVAQAAPALVVFFVSKIKTGKPRFRSRSHPLLRYVLPGLSIGILAPGSMLIARGIVGEALSWHEAGVLQALWRVADWVCAFAAGILSVYFLPRFAASRASPLLLMDEMRRAAVMILLPAIAVFAVLFLAHRPLVAALYGPDFGATDGAAALLFTGSAVRIGSWIPLFALYAMRRTPAITIGELLSLPLFAVLLLIFKNHLSLGTAGALWTAAYAAYGAFNFWAVKRDQ
jgi:PST family polysaccharide transporter